MAYTQSIVSSYIDISIKACTWRLLVLSYPHVINSGWGKSTPRRKNNNNRVIAVIPTPVKKHKTVLMYFLNIETLHDVIYVQNNGF